MKNNEIMKHRVVVAGCMCLLLGTLSVWAQPKARAEREKQKQEIADDGMSVRAQSRYPRSKGLPEDVVWMREIYRSVDLTRKENGALYFPVEPIGEQMNLFCQIFRLLGQKKISAYEYMLDGTERLTENSKVDFLDVLDRFQIYYERRKVKNRKDSVLVLDNSDIPSADVKSYFIKEVWYFDQRSSTFGSAVTAICPVLHRAEEFSMEPVKLPMFWIDYTELAPYLTETKVMTSDLNNVANTTLDDFFLSRRYQGDIYKTTNLLNQTLAQYCPNDSAMKQEQLRIEKELMSVEDHLYGIVPAVEKKDKQPTEEVDKSAENEDENSADEEKKEEKKNSKKVGRDSKATKVRSSKPKSASQSAPKASVRRQRR